MVKKKRVKLSDIADIIMGQSPKSTFYNLDGNGLPFFQGRAEFGEIYPVVKNWCTKPLRTAKKNDVLMTVRAPVGDLNIAQEECIIGRGLCALRSKLNNSRFLYYLLKGNKSYIMSFGTGSVYDAVNKDTIDNLIFEIPDELTQRKISSILSAYDDLIENNTRRIQILEEMAQRIYKEWFVDFRFPGHEKVKFVDSELGKIPEGWCIEQLDKYVDFERGIEPGSANYEEYPNKGNVPFIRVGDLNNRSSDIFVNQSLTKNKIIREDDIVVSMDGTPGIVKMGFFGCYSTGIRKLIIKNNIMKKSFLYFLMLSEHIQNIIKAHSKGTTILHASESIKYMNFILPDYDLMKIFDDIVNPMIKQILFFNKKNKILRQTRDLLLPKLISGELDVSDLDITIREQEI